jgi:hypothetical protein
MSFNKKEIQSKFKALMGIFPTDGIKSEDLHIFCRSSPSLAKICNPETGNAAMANGFIDLTESYTTKKNVATFLAVMVDCFPVLNGDVLAFDKEDFLNIPTKDQAKNIANHLETLMVHCWLGINFESHGNSKWNIKSKTTTSSTSHSSA